MQTLAIANIKTCGHAAVTKAEHIISILFLFLIFRHQCQ